MKLPIVLFVFLCAAAPLRAEMHLFTDSDGRKLTAEPLEGADGSITVKRKEDGRKFTLQLAKLCTEDKAWAEKWLKKREADTKAAARAIEVPARLVAYCKEKMGVQVGNGECWTLADEAFKACGLKRPGNDLRVWGRKLDLKTDKPQPGDIAEFRTAKFSDGSLTGPEHTAVVVGTAKRKRVVIAEQNWSGVKKVHEREMDPEGLLSGELMFYRPE